MENNTLTHHGILGQRWGVRRYQNKDGSLTPAGKKRYDDDDDNDQKSSSSSAPRKKSLSEMSDEEIIQAMNRKRLEDQYMSMFPRQVSAGERFVKKALNDVVAPAAVNAGKEILTNTLKKAGNELLGIKPEKTTNWSEAIKKQTYETQQKKSVLEDLKREHDIEKENYEYEQWLKSVGKKKKK